MEQHISKRNYEITVVQEIHISGLELQRCPLEYVISFPKVYIWDWGLANSFWDHVIQIPIRQLNFPYIYFPNYEKLNSLVEICPPYI